MAGSVGVKDSPLEDALLLLTLVGKDQNEHYWMCADKPVKFRWRNL